MGETRVRKLKRTTKRPCGAEKAIESVNQKLNNLDLLQDRDLDSAHPLPLDAPSGLEGLSEASTAINSVDASGDEEFTSLIEIRGTESKGQAVFATRKIKPGTLVLVETPVIRLTQSEEDEDKDEGTASAEESILETRFQALSHSDQKLFLKLFDSEKSGFSKVKSIYYSNCYNLSGQNKPAKGSPGGSAIGLIASRINHSCLQNVQFSFDEIANKMMFRAIKPIPRGKEVVSNYDSPFELRATRQRKQLLYYGFKCDCEACDAKTVFWTKSDERRRDMIEAYRKIRDCEKVFKESGTVPDDADPTSNLERLEAMLVKEGISGLPLADTYRNMSKWAERKKNTKVAQKWKAKELEICILCLGEQSPRIDLVRAKLNELMK